MTQINKWFAGEDFQGYFLGVVESRQDPLELGRVQVRIFGVHNPSLTEIPSSDLPWATIVQPFGGKAFSTPKESDVVVGFWLDGSKQMPCVWGVIPGIESNAPTTGSGFHDLRSQATIALAPKVPVSRKYNTDGSGIAITEADTSNPTVLESLRHPNADELGNPSISGVARYQNLANTVIQARKSNLDKGVVTAEGVKWSEPYPAYNPEYPYDNATVTESGHVFELDDTPGSERIQLAHRSGSFIEWFPTGTVVEKITKSAYTIVMADDHLHVMGRVMVTVDGDALIRVKGDIVLEGGSDFSANIAGDVDFSVGGDFNIKATNFNVEAAEDATIIAATHHYTGSQSIDITSGVTTVGSDGDLNLHSGGDLNAEGGNINLLAEGLAAMTGGEVGISGSVQINGLTSVNQGAPTASGAGSPASGQAAGLPDAIAKLTKNTGVASPEEVPTPIDIERVQLDPVTGVAFVQKQFLVTSPTGTMVTPDANATVNTANCLFDPMTKTFLTSTSSWVISQNGLALIQSAEGFAKVVSPNMVTAYPDPVTKGEPLTIGYGSTAVAIGKPVTLGELISRETAQNYLTDSVTNEFLPTLQNSITAKITQNMLDACISLIYNIGPNNWLKSSVLKNINAQNWCAAGNAFLLWNKAKGNVVPGLTQRRTKERTLFLT